VTEDNINIAVKAAVKHLREQQAGNGIWHYTFRSEDKDLGCTALVGLALLEAGVPANDPAVARAANYLRVAAPDLTEIYSMALTIMFLDRLGGTAESYTIKNLARRIMKGQVDGGWSYTWNDTSGTSPGSPGILSATGSGAPARGTTVIADNSNTQFAILALWIARKHGSDVEAALLAAEKRFRASQARDGGWGYGRAPDVADKTTPSMTCAGLLALGIGNGVGMEKEARLRAVGKPGAPPAAAPPPPAPKRDIAEDTAVKDALAYLSKYVGNDVAEVPEWLYFLWSLERVCMAYKFKTVGKVDWYEWGARKLLKTQDNDGGWNDKYGSAVDTSWAILFLRRSDLVGNIRTAEIRAGKGNEPPGKDAAASAKPPASGTAAAPARPAATPPANDTAEVDASKLAAALVYARDQKQVDLIAEYQKKPGVAHTLALATAIKELSAEPQAKARTALAARLQRFSVATLERYLEDEDRELRLAAATATGVKGKKETVPALMRTLKDRDAMVASAAHEALKSITGQKFGPNPGPWEAWWKANSTEPEK
jgi:hypothetical protein